MNRILLLIITGIVIINIKSILLHIITVIVILIIMTIVMIIIIILLQSRETRLWAGPAFRGVGQAMESN